MDVAKLAELGRKIAERALDNSCTRWTFCLENDPTVGYSIREGEDEVAFEKQFGPYRPYDTEVEISRVVLPTEARALIMKQLAR